MARNVVRVASYQKFKELPFFKFVERLCNIILNVGEKMMVLQMLFLTPTKGTYSFNLLCSKIWHHPWNLKRLWRWALIHFYIPYISILFEKNSSNYNLIFLLRNQGDLFPARFVHQLPLQLAASTTLALTPSLPWFSDLWNWVKYEDTKSC